MNTTVRTKSPRASEDLELNLGKVSIRELNQQSVPGTQRKQNLHSLDVESGQ